MKKKQALESLRDEWLNLYRHGLSHSLRGKREIWKDVEKLLTDFGLNKGERLAVCNEFLEEGRVAAKEEEAEP